MNKLRNFFRSFGCVICKFCGEPAKPIMIYGKHYYNTAPCKCPEGRASVYQWLRDMDAAWTPLPKTEQQLQIEALNRIADALEHRV